MGAQALDLQQGRVDGGLGLLVNVNDLHASLDQQVDGRGLMVRHQVHVAGDLRAAADGLDVAQAHAQVGHEVAIHHVEVEAVAASLNQLVDLLAQAKEVGTHHRGQ